MSIGKRGAESALFSRFELIVDKEELVFMCLYLVIDTLFAFGTRLSNLLELSFMIGHFVPQVFEEFGVVGLSGRLNTILHALLESSGGALG